MSTWSDKNKLFLNIPDAQLLAITAYGEAASEGREGMLAVLNVIRNRAGLVSSFGDSEIQRLTGSAYKAVILKAYQFSMYNLTDPVRAIATRMATNFQNSLATSKTLTDAYDLAKGILNNTLPDNTQGAFFYYNPTLASPTWAATLPFIGQIGAHVFYGLTSPVASPTVVALAPQVKQQEEASTSEVVAEIPIPEPILYAPLEQQYPPQEAYAPAEFQVAEASIFPDVEPVFNEIQYIIKQNPIPSYLVGGAIIALLLYKLVR